MLEEKRMNKMATTNEYIEYVCEQIKDVGKIKYKKMFGEYMVYVNDKPVVIVCDNIPFVKKLDCIEEKMQDAEVGYPYNGAKEHYILDIDNKEFSKSVIIEIEKATLLPNAKRKRSGD